MPRRESGACLGLESSGENYTEYDFCCELSSVRILSRKDLPFFLPAGCSGAEESRTTLCNCAVSLFVRATKQDKRLQSRAGRGFKVGFQGKLTTDTLAFSSSVFARAAVTKYQHRCLRTETCCLTALAATDPGAAGSAGLVPSEGCEGKSVPALPPSFCCLVAIRGILWLVDTPQSLPSCPHGVLPGCTCPRPNFPFNFYKDTSRVG